MAKDKNYIGFESGIFCVYPNYKNQNFLLKDPAKPFGCPGNQFYIDTYLNGDASKAPYHFDPRCRPWYKNQYNLSYSTFSDIYTYAGG